MLQVLYLPNAGQLTDGGFFLQHATGSWDTPESAKLVLHGLVSHHRQWLQRLKAPGGQVSLLQLAQKGLEDAPGGDEVTQIALDVKQGLYEQTQVPTCISACSAVPEHPIVCACKALVFVGLSSAMDAWPMQCKMLDAGASAGGH